MKQTGISLPDLIRYFQGTASETLRTRIEQYKDRSPSFAEEWEEWQDYVNSFESLSEAIEQLWELHQEWFEVELPE